VGVNSGLLALNDPLVNNDDDDNWSCLSCCILRRMIFSFVLLRIIDVEISSMAFADFIGS